MDSPALLPQPKRMTIHATQLALGHAAVRFAPDQPELKRLARLAEEILDCTQTESDVPTLVQLDLAAEGTLPAQGYHLVIDPDHIQLTAAEPAGMFYGLMTLKQLRRQYGDSLPGLEIEDDPSLPVRGVMLDVSRDKVTTLETLFALIDELAEWKINHFELYSEHTFAYSKHPDVWAQASPYTAEDIQRLDTYCRERFVDLVPNQNSFGHFKRWLDCPRYRQLAELTGSFTTITGNEKQGPWSLDLTNPKSLDLLDGMYAELLPNFSSEDFHIGFDEPWDFGHGRSRARAEAIGRDRLFLENLEAVCRLAQKHGKRPLYWSDMVWNYFPELVAELPDDAVAVDWGYIGAYPFAEHGAVYAEAGVPFMVASGTSTWSTICGCSQTAWDNNRNAALQGAETGALGILNTDWGDGGHWQYQAISLLPYAIGAAQAWCPESNDRDAVMASANQHVFQDAAGVMADFAWDLGCTWEKTGDDITVAHVLDRIIRDGPDWPRDPRVTVETLGKTREHVEGTLGRLGQADMQRSDAAIVTAEFENCARFLYHACDVGIAVLSNCYGQRDHALTCGSQMRELLGEHRRLWCLRNRVGGLQDSARALEERLVEYDRRAME